MMKGSTVLGLIPARGGSKEIPGKNLRKLAGKPLIEWAIEAALASNFIDRLVVSSDNPEIIQTATLAGCEAPFVRPAELATDTARSIDVAHHAMDSVDGKFEFLVLIQPTSPLVSPGDIDGCLLRCSDHNAQACVTVSKVHPSPAWMFYMEPAFNLNPLLVDAKMPSRRQDSPQVFALNGAVYAAHCEWLSKQDSFVGSQTRGYEMPASRSLDIDSELDFTLAEALINGKHNGLH